MGQKLLEFHILRDQDTGVVILIEGHMVLHLEGFFIFNRIYFISYKITDMID